MPADVRHAIRLFLRRPAFSAAVILTLGLGIGATTAIFSLVRAVLLRPLPCAGPDRLVFAWGGVRAPADRHPHTVYQPRRDRLASAQRRSLSIVGQRLDPMMDRRPGRAGSTRGLRHGELFELVGVSAALGWTFGS